MRQCVRWGALFLAACFAVFMTACTKPEAPPSTSSPADEKQPQETDVLTRYEEALKAWAEASAKDSTVELTMTTMFEGVNLTIQRQLHMRTDGQRFQLDIAAKQLEEETALSFYYDGGWFYLDDGQVPVKMQVGMEEATEAARHFGYFAFVEPDVSQLTEVKPTEEKNGLTARFPGIQLKSLVEEIFQSEQVEPEGLDLLFSDAAYRVLLDGDGGLLSREVSAEVNVQLKERSDWRITLKETVEGSGADVQIVLPENAGDFVEYDPNAGV